MHRPPLAFLLGLTLGSTAFSQLAPDPNNSSSPPEVPLNDEEFHLPVDPQTAAEVDRLIPLLNSPTFSEREKATESLLTIGAPAFAKLRDAYAGSDELELQLRISEVVRTSYMNHHVFGRHGFLGVSLSALDTVSKTKGPPAATQQDGFVIGAVTTDSAASKGGLKAEDVVFSIDGQPVVGRGQDVIESFRRKIQTSLPGTKMKLGILRAEGKMEIEVTLGRATEDIARRTRLPFTDKYSVAQAQFPTWWAKYFLRQSGSQSPAPRNDR